MRLQVLLVILASVAVFGSDNYRGVRPRDLPVFESKISQGKFNCLDGSDVIDVAFINDDYCDCADGSDEPGTSACEKGKFWCVNKGFMGHYEPASRVNDGICDCCDGSDEWNTSVSCVNDCAELGELAQKEEVETIARIERGAAKRAQLLAQGASSLEQSAKAFAALEQEKAELEQEITTAKALVEAEELLEEAEQKRLLEEWEAKYGELEAQRIAEEELAAAAAAAASEAEAEEENTDNTEGKEGEEEENFPYPAEYAFNQDGNTEAETEAEEKEEEVENFPYPEEYAFHNTDDGGENSDADIVDADDMMADEDDEDHDGANTDGDGADGEADSDAIPDRPDHERKDDKTKTGDEENREALEKREKERQKDRRLRQIEREKLRKEAERLRTEKWDKMNIWGKMWQRVIDLLEIIVVCVEQVAQTIASLLGNNNDTNENNTYDFGRSESDFDMNKQKENNAIRNHKSPEAEEARKALRDLENKLKTVDRKYNDKKTKQNLDYGPENMFAYMDGVCFELVVKQYTYEFCPFGTSRQKENGRGGTSLGNYKRYEAGDDGDYTLVFDGGQTCWNGPQRSLTVHMTCYDDDVIFSVEEPGKCIYHMEFGTPILCYAEHAQAKRLNLEMGFEDEEDFMM